MCGRLSYVVHGPIYSRFMPGFYCKRFSLYNTTLAYTLCFECYTNGNTHARRCSYVEHGLPVVFLKRISSFWAEHFKDIFRMISHKHPVNKNLINLNPEIIYEIYYGFFYEWYLYQWYLRGNPTKPAKLTVDFITYEMFNTFHSRRTLLL